MAELTDADREEEVGAVVDVVGVVVAVVEVWMVDVAATVFELAVAVRFGADVGFLAASVAVV